MSREKKYKIIIILLSVLLAVSVVLLAVQLVRKTILSSDEATVSNNSIGTVEKNWTFCAENLLPGDSESKDYTITYRLEKDAPVLFCIKADRDEGDFAEVLYVLVEDAASGETVCRGKLSEIVGQKFADTVTYDGQKQKAVTYKITLTLGTEAGNEYQDAEIALRFRWFLEEEGDGQ